MPRMQRYTTSYCETAIVVEYIADELQAEPSKISLAFGIVSHPIPQVSRNR